KLRCVARGKSEELAEENLRVFRDEIMNRLKGLPVFGETPSTLSLPHGIVATMKKLGMTISFAESCTGGLVSATITEVAGSSHVFRQSWVTYSNEAKRDSLGVDPDIIERFGAVSVECAEAMAIGA